MKKVKSIQKKLSLNKLQLTKIKNGLNSIKGGSEFNGGNGQTDTVDDKTNKTINNTISIMTNSN